jgi:hypothetical protein
MYSYLAALRNAPELDSPSLESRHSEIVGRVEEEIRRIDAIRAREWDRQQSVVGNNDEQKPQSSRATNPKETENQPAYVDCGELIMFQC